MITDDLERDCDRAVMLCHDAHARLLQRLDGLSDSVVRSPSRLPGWTVGHVVAHLARNADAHARRLDGALAGVDAPKYVGGGRQRGEEISSGARRPAHELLQDLADSQSRLNKLLSQCVVECWPHGNFLGGGHYPVTACPAHRLREVEMHHVDLGLGYTPDDWSDTYIAWELPNLLASAASRVVEPSQRCALTAWLAGRAQQPGPITLTPW